MSRKLHFLFAAVFAALLASCTNLDLDNMGEAGLSPSLVLPIGSFSASVDQFTSSMDSTYIKVDEESKMFYFEWAMEKDTIVAFDMSSYIQGSELNIDLHLSEMGTLASVSDVAHSTTGEPLPAGDYRFTSENLYSFGFNEYVEGVKEYRLDSCYLTTATLFLEISTSGMTLTESNFLDVEILFPTIIDDGKPLVLTTRLTSDAGRVDGEYSNFPLKFLEGYDSNVVEMVASFVYHSDGTALMDRNAVVSFSTRFNFMGMEQVYGYFYNVDPLDSDVNTTDIPESSFVDKLLGDNKLLVHDPQFHISLSSNVGVPLSAQIGNIVVEGRNGEKVQLMFDGSTVMDIDLNMPVLSNGHTVPARTDTTLNRDNAETNKLFTILPDKLSYYWAGYADNPDRSMVHFVTNDPYIVADARVYLPFVLDPGSYIKYDTIIDADLTALLPDEHFSIESLNLYLDVANAIPLALDVQLSFLDENDNLLFEGEKTRLESAEVDLEGRATAPSSQKLEIKCVGETIDKILKTKRIGLNTTVSGKDASSGIFLQTTDSLSMNIGAFVKLNAKMNINTSDNDSSVGE